MSCSVAVRRACTCLVVDSHVRTCTLFACVAVQTCLFEVLKFVDFECLQNSIALYLELLFLGTT